MAEFDPSKYQRIVKPGVQSSGGFDPSKYQRIVKPQTDKSFLESLKQQSWEALKQQPLIAADIGGGVLAALQNPISRVTSYLPQGMQVPRYDPKPLSDAGWWPIEAGKLLGSFAPGLAGEKLALGVLGAAKFIPPALARVAAAAAGGAASSPSLDVSPTTGGVVGAIGAVLPGWASRMALGAAGGAAVASSFDMNPLGGAVLGGAGLSIPGARAAALGKLLGRNVTPKQFQAAREAVPENIKAPIGELANSPRAKKAYGRARGIALSQADTPYNQLHDHLSKGVKELVEDAPGVSNPSQFVYDDIKGSYEAAKKNTARAYSDLAENADASKTPFVRNKFDSVIDEDLKQINKLSINETARKSYKNAVDALEDFRSTNIKTFGDAVDARFAINDLIGDFAGKEGDKKTLRFLKRMKTGLDDSISESAVQNPGLMKMHTAANDARIEQGTFEKLNRKDATPFYKIYSKGGTPDNLISSHIRTSNKGGDFSGLLSSLTEKLSPEAKSVVAKAHINPQGESSLAKQLGKLGELSPGQKNAMFGGKAPLAHELSKLSGIFPAAKGADFTPLTGYTGSKITQLLAEVGGLGAAGTAAALHSPGAALAAAGTVAALPAYAQISQRILRSKALKDVYANYLKTAKGKPLTKSKFTERLARALALSASGGNSDGS